MQVESVRQQWHLMQVFNGLGFKCFCPVGYTGPLCNDLISYFTADSCKNGAACIEKPPGGHFCYCLSGFTGVDCSVTINLCQSTPCQNGAKCNSFQNLHVFVFARLFGSELCIHNTTVLVDTVRQRGYLRRLKQWKLSMHLFDVLSGL